MVENGDGAAMLLVTRGGGGTFSARFLCGAAFYEFSGARDADVSARLAEAIGRDRGAAVRSLRRDVKMNHARATTLCAPEDGTGMMLTRRVIGLIMLLASGSA
jgi:hypothetical protein